MLSDSLDRLWVACGSFSDSQEESRAAPILRRRVPRVENPKVHSSRYAPFAFGLRALIPSLQYRRARIGGAAVGRQGLRAATLYGFYSAQ